MWHDARVPGASPVRCRDSLPPGRHNARAAVAASGAFRMPVGTAPNAIVYGSGRVEIRDMLRAGLLMNILGWGVIIAVSSLTLRWLG